MKFTVSSTTLCSRIQNISKVQNSKSALPILDCILLELRDGTLFMTASDSETTIQTNIELTEAEGEGKFAVDAKQFINSIKEISEQPITLNVNEANNEVEVNYQNGYYRFIAQNGYEYPLPIQNDTPNNEVVIPACKLLDGITRTLFATGDDEIRQMMNGVYFDLTTECLVFVASDGRKLVRNRMFSIKSEAPSSFILPKKPANILKTILLKEDGDAVIRYSAQNAQIALNNYSITCRLIDARYPNYDSVIPKNNPYHLTVDRIAFISALRRVSVFASASNALVKLHVENNTLDVSAQDIDFSTSAEEKLLCDYDGIPMSIGFNGPFLLDVLNNIVCQDIIISLADPSRAGVLVPAENEDDEDLLMLLMPITIND